GEEKELPHATTVAGEEVISATVRPPGLFRHHAQLLAFSYSHLVPERRRTMLGTLFKLLHELGALLEEGGGSLPSPPVGPAALLAHLLSLAAFVIPVSTESRPVAVGATRLALDMASLPALPNSSGTGGGCPAPEAAAANPLSFPGGAVACPSSSGPGAAPLGALGAAHLHFLTVFPSDELEGVRAWNECSDGGPAVLSGAAEEFMRGELPHLRETLQLALQFGARLHSVRDSGRVFFCAWRLLGSTVVLDPARGAALEQ
ncbi:unnamed protein product, partial [Discosporangium mesarthrocarpum]